MLPALGSSTEGSRSTPGTTTKPSARVSLMNVYDHMGCHVYLYKLLAERDETVNINHNSLPTWEQHVTFVNSRPYAVWKFIETEDETVGACYLTKLDELGIFIFKRHQGNGYGKEALKLLMAECGPRKYVAHINPRNERSKALFAALGFTHVQETYEYRGA